MEKKKKKILIHEFRILVMHEEGVRNPTVPIVERILWNVARIWTNGIHMMLLHGNVFPALFINLNSFFLIGK